MLAHSKMNYSNNFPQNIYKFLLFTQNMLATVYTQMKAVTHPYFCC